MNANLLLSDETTFRLASTMLHFLWQGAILGSLAWGILHVLAIGRAQVRYAIYFGLLLVLAMAPIATFVALSANVRQTLAPIPARKLSVVSADRGSSPSGIAEASSAAKSNTSLTLTPWVNRYQSWLVAFWIAGVFVLGVRLIVSAAGTWSIVRERQPPSQEIIEVVGRLTRSMAFRVQPNVSLVEQISQALAVGIFKPMILLPAAWALELSPTMLEAVLAHELAHLRRWDLPINLLQRLVETCLFFHPVVWWCSRRMRIERELCCDERAIQATGNRLRYAEALTYLAEQQHASSQPLLAAGIGGTSMVLLERIRNVLGMSTRSRGRFYGVSCAFVGAAAASAVWLLFLPTADKQAEPEANRPLASAGEDPGTSGPGPSETAMSDKSSLPAHVPMRTAHKSARQRPILHYVQLFGNKKFTRRTLAKETGLSRGSPFDDADVHNAASKIIAYYEAHGLEAKVEIIDGLEADSQGASFLIQEGDTSADIAIRFEGNNPEIAPDARLRAAIDPQGANPYERASAIEKLVEYYRALGFFRAKISRRLSASPKDDLTVVYVIHEHQRFRVGDVSFAGTNALPSETLAQSLTLRTGRHFDHATMKNDVEAIKTAYKTTGCFVADVMPDLQFKSDQPGQVDIIYRLKEGRLADANSKLPSEKNMMALPTYIIEPPDILFIEARNIVPKSTYRIQPSDQLRIEWERPANGAPQHAADNYVVDSAGSIKLGSREARLGVQGRTTAEVAEAIHKAQPGSRAIVKVTHAAALQQIHGEHLVSPDGTVNLGTHGFVRLAGKTAEEARTAVEAHLSKTLESPKIDLSVFAYNSKVYYVISEKQNSQDMVARFPATGNETVLDVLAQVDVRRTGDPLSNKEIWIARPQGSSAGDDVIVPVNFEQIAQRGHPELNYQVFPGDRIFIRETSAPRPTAPSDAARPEPPPVHVE